MFVELLLVRFNLSFDAEISLPQEIISFPDTSSQILGICWCHVISLTVLQLAHLIEKALIVFEKILQLLLFVRFRLLFEIYSRAERDVRDRNRVV